jgi:hypothetical protein
MAMLRAVWLAQFVFWLALWLPLGSAANAGNAIGPGPAVPGQLIGPVPVVPGQLIGPQPVPNVPNVATPYRFAPAPSPLSPLDQQKALDYRAQLQDQQRTLDAQGSQGQLNPAQRELQLDTRSELNRVDRMLGR